MKYILANWKMNVKKDDILAFIKKSKIKPKKTTYVGIAMPTIYMGYAEKLRKYSHIGVQDVCEYTNGAYTGCISAQMAKDVGAEFCLVGHSERRTHCNESNAKICEKIKRVQEQNMIPVLCIGESAEEYKDGTTNQVLAKQLAECLEGVDKYSQIIVAYEPVWAIGTGESANVYKIAEIVEFIKEQIKNILGESYPAIVLYGGSVNPENCANIARHSRADGVLVGGASLDSEKFNAIIKSFE